MFLPDPAHLARGIILIFSKPELAFLTNDIKDLERISNEDIFGGYCAAVLPRLRHMSNMDNPLLSGLDQC